MKELEIYKQRYETYRHLDRLQWQMLQIAVGAVSVVVLVLARTDSDLEWWMFTTTGVMLSLFGIAMLRIRHGLNKNNRILREVARKIGDIDIPGNGKWYKSIGTLIAITLVVSGVVMTLVSIGCALIHTIH